MWQNTEKEAPSLAKKRRIERKRERLSLLVLAVVFLVVVIRPLLLDRPPGEDTDGYVFPPPLATKPFPLQVYNHRQGKLLTMDLEEYLVGVVAAEMPASFHPEALRAQAVAARTYTLQKALDRGGCEKHPGAQVCTDHTHCQAWTSPESIRSRPDGEALLQRLQGAVSSTAGLVLTSGGQRIDAVYHSTCGGHTAAAHQVWVGSAPYLEAVECGYCNHSPWYNTRAEITYSRFRQIFSPRSTVPVMTAQGQPILRVLEASSQGRVKTFQVGTGSYSAWQFRQLLDLPSAWLTYTFQGDSIHFALRGYGHGVGLCQYGADGMGRAGRTFEDILHHYYRGVVIGPWSGP
jgi:stage II sporulation protein D